MWGRQQRSYPFLSPTAFPIALSCLASLPVVVWHSSILVLKFFSCNVSVSNAGTLECHLCNSNWASLRIVCTDSFNCCVRRTVDPPVVRSSTYRLQRISSTSAGNRSRQSSRCSRKSPPSKKGDVAKPKRACVKCNASISLVFRSLYQ